MTDYYNEIDTYAAQWIRNLINAGHLPHGIVDERSIEDVYPSDLRGFRQCHFFAGIGVWALALQRAGWPGDRSVWTGSCPCQPFSAAGKGAGFDDERHLWPAFHHLIKECNPAIVLGEQVASKDAGSWIDLVHTDLEALGYTFGAVPFPSASVGAPHIRDRLYWVADAGSAGLEKRMRYGAKPGAAQSRGNAHAGSSPPRRMEHTGHNNDAGQGQAASARESQADRPANIAGGPGISLGGLEYALHIGWQRGQEAAPGHDDDGEAPERAQGEYGAGIASAHRLHQDAAGPTNSQWRAADWLLCRDGKWRPVEPGTFPLAHGATSRVGRLRAYGNAINAIQAQIFIESLM